MKVSKKQLLEFAKEWKYAKSAEDKLLITIFADRNVLKAWKRLSFKEQEKLINDC